MPNLCLRAVNYQHPTLLEGCWLTFDLDCNTKNVEILLQGEAAAHRNSIWTEEAHREESELVAKVAKIVES